MMIGRSELTVDEGLARLIEDEILPGTGVDPARFWAGAAAIFARFAPENARLLAVRDDFQALIDGWHRDRVGQPIDMQAYQRFLREIGYLALEPDPFTITPANVDDEVARLAGPQLVVPVLNARFLLNAANARWGSLYDALYGTDAIPGRPTGPGYDPTRGAQVIAWARDFLDQAVPLAQGSCTDFAGGKPALRLSRFKAVRTRSSATARRGSFLSEAKRGLSSSEIAGTKLRLRGELRDSSSIVRAASALRPDKASMVAWFTFRMAPPSPALGSCELFLEKTARR